MILGLARRKDTGLKMFGFHEYSKTARKKLQKAGRQFTFSWWHWSTVRKVKGCGTFSQVGSWSKTGAGLRGENFRIDRASPSG